MNTWRSTTLDEVKSILQQELEELHPVFRQRFERMQVVPRRVPVERYPSEHVWVVAEHEGQILYWSDVEEGWELESPNPSGGIKDRGSNQYRLSHVMYQLFGEPEPLQ